MAFKVAKGTLTQPGADGNQTISLAANFDPQVIRLWATTRTADGVSAAADANTFGYGVGTYRGAAVQQWCCARSAASSDPTTADGGHGNWNDALLKLFASGAQPGAVDLEIDLVSMSVGATSNVVINWVNRHSTASIIVHYLVLGGDDLDDAYAFTTTPVIAATQDISAVAGFGQPDLVMFGGNYEAPGTTAGQGRLMVGWGNKALEQVVLADAYGDTGNVTANVYHRADRVLAAIIATGSMDYEASLSAVSQWPTDGIELTWDNQSPNTTDMLGFLFLKGTFQSKIGVADCPTTVSDQDIALSFTPVGVDLFSAGSQASDVLATAFTDRPNWCLGASDGTTEGCSLWCDDDANAAQRVRHRLSTSKCVQMVTQNGTTHTLIGEADAVFQNNNLRLSWTTAPSQAQRFAYVALGSAATSVNHLAAATVAAVSTVTVTATVAHLAAATIAAVSTVTASATAVIHHQAQATVGATSAVAAVASVAHLAQATIGAVSSITAVATTTTSGISAGVLMPLLGV